MAVELTIGMATFADFDGVFFTIQSLRLYQDLRHTEILVVDNHGCPKTADFCKQARVKYILAKDKIGTAAPRDLVFQEAQGEAILCIDCHILLASRAIKQLKLFYRDNPYCLDLLQGPLAHDDLVNISTHFDPVWREEMWGTWGFDRRGFGREPFEIMMQGLGLFSCRKQAWLGFNPLFRGFGGEEGYIHEKFRQAGRKCLCLPWLKWAHRFRVQSEPVPYRIRTEDKIFNYAVGHYELGLPLQPIIQHFSTRIDKTKVLQVVNEAVAAAKASQSEHVHV